MSDTVVSFLTQGGAAALILCIVIIESLLLFLRYLRGAGTPPVQWLSPLVAGGALVLALLLTQLAAPPPFIGMCLAFAGLAHALGYRQRWLDR